MKGKVPFTLIISLLLLFTLTACKESDDDVKETKTEDVSIPKVLKIERQSPSNISFTLKAKYDALKASDLVLREYGLDNFLPVAAVSNVKGGKEYLLTLSSAMSLQTNYELGTISGAKTNYIEAQFGDALWNSIYSDKEMGVTENGGKFTFRVFSPRANKVLLCVFDKPYQFTNDFMRSDELRKGRDKYDGETQLEMVKDKDGVWECTVTGSYWGKLYGYRVWGPKGGSENFHPEFIVADPYSKAIATYQVSPQHHLTVIVDPSKYKWESKNKYAPIKRREAIIYESHVRDLTMLSPDVRGKGTYEGLVEDGKTGGLAHLKELGVNIIELLPTHEFDEIEEPYYEKGYANKWNTYGRNHWGYMTTCFFAPESFYYEGKVKPNTWIGVSGGQVYAFKKMVDVFHKNGIGVMMDVVFNHVSQYDRNPFKFIDQKYYFWLNDGGAMDAKSGCGNDYRSDRPMARRVIVDSCRYWVDEYHVDGYRFDLGTIIDWKTYEALVPQVRGLNPNCHLTAEPWMGGRGEPRDGGGYALNDNANGFDKRDIGAWNDKVRIVARNGGNLVFGGANLADLRNAVMVYPKLFKNPANSFNYIESHDNNTLSDIIRQENKEFKKTDEIDFTKYLELCKLNEKSLKQNKLGAIFLLTLQGPIMLHEGQEFARMKVVIPPSGDNVFPNGEANWVKIEKKWYNVKDDGKVTNKWSQKAAPYLIDHDSYEKDNEGNWINWKLRDVNKDLFDYYKGLIRIRKENRAFSTMDVTKIAILDAKATGESKSKPKSAIGYVYDKKFTEDKKNFAILINGSWNPVVFDLPAGDWDVLADGTTANPKGLGKKLTGTVEVPPMSGYIVCQ